MHMNTETIFGIPEDTARAARSVYNLHTVYIQIGDNLNKIVQGLDLTCLGEHYNLSNASILRLSLATTFQFAESLPDQLAFEATLKRMDWKYALYLPIQHPGIPKIALCNFRQGIFDSPRKQIELNKLLANLEDYGLFSISKVDGLTANNTIAFVCRLNRFYGLHQSMKAMLSLLVSRHPEWVAKYISPYWYLRYSTGNLSQVFFASLRNIHEEAIRLGQDIHYLLTILKEGELTDLNEKTELKHVTQLFNEQFELVGDQLHWRTPDCRNCSSEILGNLNS